MKNFLLVASASLMLAACGSSARDNAGTSAGGGDERARDPGYYPGTPPPGTPSDTGTSFSDGATSDAGGPSSDTAVGDTGAVDSGPTERATENPFVDVAKEPTSTFSIDVDTASYAIARRDLVAGKLPDPTSVRTEEFLNYFDYADTPPTTTPFAVSIEGAPSPFGASATAGESGYSLLRIGVKGKVVDEGSRLPANLVFLIDVSGSMSAENKLPLVKFALKELVRKLDQRDTLAIVVYAGRQATLLEPTPVGEKSKIYDAIDSLSSGGSTAGEAGLRRAYSLAEGAFRKGGINRVVIATDGDWNVGLTGEDLLKFVATERDKGVAVTCLGFGISKDSFMEQIADRGNGNYAYIDTRGEALRVLGERLVSTLQVIAKDVKIQVDFDASTVKRYRLLGYENRMLRTEDFRDDTKDAGELGAGHTVTALYELETMPDFLTKPLAPLATVKLAYKTPEGTVSSYVSTDLKAGLFRGSFEAASAGFRLSAAVAEFAEILRNSIYSTGKDYDRVLTIAKAAMGPSATPDKREFLTLVEKAKTAK